MAFFRLAPTLNWGSIAIGVVTVLGAALGLLRLSGSSVWLDEAVSANLAEVPLGDFLSIAASKEANMGLYYLLLRPILWFGNGEFALRFLSVAFLTATIPVIYWIGCRFGRSIGLTAAALFTVNAFMVHYAHQARGYTMAAFFSALTTLLLLRSMESQRLAHWLAYGVTAGIGLYAHFFVGLIIIAQAITVVVRSDLRPSARNAAACLGPLLCAAFPLALFFRGQTGGQIDWIPRTTLGTIVPTFKALTGLGGRALLVAYFVATVLGLVAIARSAGRERTNGLVLAMTCSIPLALTFGISLAVPIVRPQYLIVVVPMLALLAAIGVFRLQSLATRGLVAAVLAYLTLTALPGAYANLETHDWRGATRFVLDQSRLEDGIIFYVYYGWTPFRFYVSSDTSESAPRPIYPARDWHPPALVSEAPLGRYVSSITQHQRIWLVLNNARTDRPPDELKRLLAELTARGFRQAAYDEFRGGIRVRRYDRGTIGSAR